MTVDNPRRIGLIADVHANLPALEAVLDDMEPVDMLIHAGDVIGYGPWPNACIETLREHAAKSVQGNHDAAIFEDLIYESGDQYADDVLTEEHRSWLASLPDIKTLVDGTIKVVHGHPGDPFKYTHHSEFDHTLLDDEEVLILGHTHVQSKATFVDGTVVNPGSVGQPRDGDPRAAYGILDIDTMTVTLHRTAYDIEAVVDKIEETPISSHNAHRLYDGA